MDIHLKKYRKEFEHSYSFGVFPTLELLDCRLQGVIKVLISSKGRRNEGVAKIEELCERGRISVEINDKLIERISPRENAYAVGVFEKYEEHLDKAGDHVVLVNPGDMGNLGTIIRTMAGFGVTNLALIRPGADIFDPRVIRASMGAIFRLSFEYFDGFDAYRQAFAQNIYAFMVNGNERLGKLDFERPFALVFGNEASGLPEEYLTLGTSVSIRHGRSIDSLSLPIAIGIALYEAAKGI